MAHRNTNTSGGALLHLRQKTLSIEDRRRGSSLCSKLLQVNRAQRIKEDGEINEKHWNKIRKSKE
jgi:hypothetical protein